MLTNPRNICIITSSLMKGGAERSAAIQSQILNSLGFNVFIVSVLKGVEYKYKGKLLNLGTLKEQKDGFTHRVNRLFILKKFIKDNQIDLLIDHRSRNSFYRELFLKLFLFQNIKSIFVVHSYNLSKSFPKSKLLARLIYPKETILVSVSKAIKTKLHEYYGFKNITPIYNTIQLETIEKLSFDNSIKENYILFFGRFDEDAKDLTFLINAYHSSNLPKLNIKLFLLGDGPDKLKITSLIHQLNLETHIIFKPYTNNPYPLVNHAKFTVLTSNYEGFPMSLIESLACGTPVVSVDCESGPKEIVKNKFNGLLVQKDLEVYTNALNLMSSDTQLLNYCKSNCLKSIDHLSYDSIKEEWKNLINQVLK